MAKEVKERYEAKTYATQTATVVFDNETEKELSSEEAMVLILRKIEKLEAFLIKE